MMEMLDGPAFRALAPLLSLTVGVVLLLAADVVPSIRPIRRLIYVATILISLIYQGMLLASPPGEVLGGSLIADWAYGAWGVLFLLSGLIAWVFGLSYYKEERGLENEHDVLLLCSMMGMTIMAGANDLLVFFMGLELLSVPLYVLAAFRRSREDSVEAGMKYFLLGAFASAIFAYGTALIYTGTGTLSLAEMRETGAASPLALIGVALLASSLFFKAGVVPFHLWVPDVYQGSPTPVTLFMATGTKAAAFAFLLNASFLLPAEAATTVAAIALLTLAVGNLGALVQTNLKRMLAYSGIAHAGTLLLLVAACLTGGPAHEDAVRAAIYYMAAYVFTAGGAFGLIALLEADGEKYTDLESLRGLSSRRPGLAAAMALFMLSLGGIPATGGFLGKYLVFSVVVQADLIAVAVVGILLSVVALGYYLRVVVTMTMQPAGDGRGPTSRILPATMLASACAVMVLLLGVLPGWFLEQLA